MGPRRANFLDRQWVSQSGEDTGELERFWGFQEVVFQPSLAVTPLALSMGNDALSALSGGVLLYRTCD